MLSRSWISVAESIRALYIDFEGNQDQPPGFIGIRTRSDDRDDFEQLIVEQALLPVLDLPNPQGHGWPKEYQPGEGGAGTQIIPRRSANTLSGMVEALVGRAEGEDRLILSWSSHELEVVQQVPELTDELKGRFQARWRDAKDVAKTWKRKHHRSVAFQRLPGRGSHRLDCYMDLIGYCLPSYFGDRQAAARISYVRQQLLRRGSATALTPVAKAKWTKVLDYNWHDCNGMREVTIRAAKELAG